MFPKKNRLHSVAKRVSAFGYSFDSQLECGLYGYLKILVAGGELKDLRVKPNVRITDAKILMIPDFVAFDIKLGSDVYHEAKGFETEVWLLKKRLWKCYGPGRLRIFMGSARSFKMVEEIIPKV